MVIVSDYFGGLVIILDWIWDLWNRKTIVVTKPQILNTLNGPFHKGVLEE